MIANDLYGFKSFQCRFVINVFFYGSKWVLIISPFLDIIEYLINFALRLKRNGALLVSNSARNKAVEYA